MSDTNTYYVARRISDGLFIGECEHVKRLKDAIDFYIESDRPAMEEFHRELPEDHELVEVTPTLRVVPKSLRNVTRLEIKPTSGRESLLQAAEYVRINQLGSEAWITAITSFDLIKWSQHPAVLEVADQVREVHAAPEELAALLEKKASEV